MLWLKLENIQDEIFKSIRERNIDSAGKKALLKTKLMMAEGNKWLTVSAKTHRKVHFCIVSLKPQDSKEA